MNKTGEVIGSVRTRKAYLGHVIRNSKSAMLRR